VALPENSSLGFVSMLPITIIRNQVYQDAWSPVRPDALELMPLRETLISLCSVSAEMPVFCHCVVSFVMIEEQISSRLHFFFSYEFRERLDPVVLKQEKLMTRSLEREN
jgi:hypothetical protein